MPEVGLALLLHNYLQITFTHIAMRKIKEVIQPHVPVTGSN
ncbi:MAG TPA: hypothetical protein VJJ76_03650 [archaeon]|nr:hypothetical protein [archaeon]